MTRKKRILPLSVAVTLFLSSMPVMALPADTVVLGKKAFSIRSLFANVPGVQAALDVADGKMYYNLTGQNQDEFVGLFDNAPMTSDQKGELTNITYVDKGSEGFFEEIWSDFNTKVPSETPTATPTATPTTSPTAPPQLTVSNVKAINVTTIEITFSNNEVQRFSGYNLTPGVNTVRVNYQGKGYDVSVAYKASVENIEFVNYRFLKVTFNSTVDSASAVDPRNYYFEIVDGSAALGTSPTLKLSNQLSQIETAYSGASGSGAAAWWRDGNIVANTVNGKTVVDIYLPEDARFTNLKDEFSMPDDTTFKDDARTLAVYQRTSMPLRPGDIKYLIKNTNLNVSVRNVLDQNGEATINTAVRPILILDQAQPKLLSVSIPGVNTPLLTNEAGLPVNLTSNGVPFKILRTRPGYPQQKQDLNFTYSEPVYDAHCIDKSDFERFRDINLFVNNRLIASTNKNPANIDISKVVPLEQVLKFNMETNDTYDVSRTFTIDAEEAVQILAERWGDPFSLDKVYEFSFVGVTDLAGNIEVASQHTFNVKFFDNIVDNPVNVPPVVLGIEQVGDNMLRVEFNRAGATGTLEIQNADGKGGLLNAPIPESAFDSRANKFFSYVQVMAMDHELFDPIVNINTVQLPDLLVYGGQDYIFRAVKAKDIVSDDNLLGNDYPKQMTLYNDIFAPKLANVQLAERDYSDRNPNIQIPVVDVVPQSWAADNNVVYSVKPVKYEYDSTLKRYLNSTDFTCNGDYLPVMVWYEDANGARRSAMVSNQDAWLRPNGYVPTPEEYLNHGHRGSITFSNSALNVNLTQYPELLDQSNLGTPRLVPGVTYHVEIPTGYFTDDGRDIILKGMFGSREHDFTFNDKDYDLLYVDDARIPQLASLISDPLNLQHTERMRLNFTELGYTSKELAVAMYVEPVGPIQPPVMTVPQTSKELIWYDEAQDMVNVEFTGTIDATTLKNPANYTVNGQKLTSYGVTSSDIIYDVSHGRQFAKFKMPKNTIAHDGDYKFEVEGVCNPVGGMMTKVETTIKLHDNTLPYITEAKVTGQREIQLTLNEGIKYFVEEVPTADKYSAAKNFSVTKGVFNYTVLEAIKPTIIDPNGRTITLVLGSDLPEDITGLQVTVVPDQNGNVLFIDESTNRNTLKLDSINATK
jgi:hypothetical protein